VGGTETDGCTELISRSSAAYAVWQAGEGVGIVAEAFEAAERVEGVIDGQEHEELWQMTPGSKKNVARTVRCILKETML
jgi:hypothetical protein